MVRSIVLVVFLGTLSHQLFAHEETDTTLLVLDSMINMMLGESHYDRRYYKKLRNCMKYMDIRLPYVSDSSWKGMIDYWNMGGGVNDAWGSAGSRYMERNVTVTNMHDMVIYETCGYVSNVAYYHPATEICSRMNSLRRFNLPLEFLQSFVRGYSNLAMGSAFMHGSNTDLGGLQDVTTLAALAYQIHQASLASIPRNPILHDINITPRNQTAYELIIDLSSMYIYIPVEKWSNHVRSLDIPDYFLTFTAIFTTVLDISMKPKLVDLFIPVLTNTFGASPHVVDFITGKYLPELRKYTQKLQLNLLEKIRFNGNVLGTVGKLIYAFLWQEDILTNNPIFLTRRVNGIGWNSLPRINKFLGTFQTFPYFEKNFQSGEDIYPGDFNCNPAIPHAKWHLQSAIGMLDLTYLSDEMYAILSRVS